MRKFDIGATVQFRVGKEIFNGRISKQTNNLLCIDSYFVHTFINTFLINIDDFVL